MNAGQIVLLASYAVSSLAMIGCGVPLYLRKVGRNNWFGFRTRLTTSDDAIWYAANQVAGVWLIITGTGTLASALAAMFFGMNDFESAMLATGVMLTGISLCVSASFSEQRRVDEEQQWHESSDMESSSNG